MAECAASKNGIESISFQGKKYERVETVRYPNGGRSDFYVSGNNALILDHDICKVGTDNRIFRYSLITDKQNSYMRRYNKLYRFMAEDFTKLTHHQVIPDYFVQSYNREDSADASPLEFLFEKNFTDVYGMSALKYLNKEYLISDENGSSFYLDYVIHTQSGDIAVEENGVTYHHPQVIGTERYRRQLEKQNACAEWGIKLYRFSTEDCQFNSRIEDDIKTFFGSDTDNFVEKGLLLERKFELYEHQKDTLQKIREQRANGISSFLVVFPTASGKSRIIEEDLAQILKEDPERKALILAPSKVFNLAGLQSAVCIIKNKELREKMQEAFYHDDIGEPNYFVEPATVAAYTLGDEWVDELNAYLLNNKNYVKEYIAQHLPHLKVVSGHATYLMWIDTSYYQIPSETFKEELRNETGLYLHAGSHYGDNRR